MATSTDYTNLITSQHADKPKFVATIATTCQPLVDLFNVFSAMNADFDLNLAVGAQLDVVGQIIGISRQLKIPLVGVYFTLDTGPGLDNGVLIGPYDPTTGLVSLPDAYYRFLLAAKILNNYWDGTKETAYAISQAIFAPLGYTLFIQDYSNLTVALGLIGAQEPPPPIIIAMLTGGLFDLTPATVRIVSYIYPANTSPIFMLDAQPGNVNFGSLDVGAFANVKFN